ncbi:MAG TPA: haloalkane dehalogenase [Acidimicrobiia bacterium]|jgi:haloalkane dehalogenase
MDFVRTPDERFSGLVDWPYEPHYLNVPAGDGTELRMAHVDEGDGPVMLLLHGEPTWSYLYHRMIPPLVAAGFRVVAPDLIGFGRSDKPTRPEAYSYQSHVDWLESWLLQLDLQGVTLFCQDWGGLLGLRVVAAHPDRFDRVVASNTWLPTGDERPTEAFLNWQSYAANAPRLPIAKILQNSTVKEIPDEVLAGYEAPFPDDIYMVGAKVFPSLVPTSPNDPAVPANRRAWEVLATWEKPFLTAFADSDPITRGGDRGFQKRIPGAQGLDHRIIEGAGHFIQEDAGEELASLLIDFAR